MPPREGFDRVIRHDAKKLRHLTDKALEELIEETKLANIERARESSSAFVEYALPHEKTGKQITNQDFHREWHELIARNRFVALLCPVESGKALSLDTEIPTPAGFVRMGDLKAGDAVFGRDGRSCTVERAWPVQRDRRVFRVRFDDGGETLADADHNWLVWSQLDLDGSRAPTVRTTDEMLASGVRWRTGYQWKVPIAAPVEWSEKRFAIHPYVLGAWLGDGEVAGPIVTCHERDIEIVDRMVALDNGIRGKTHRDTRRPAILKVNVGGDCDSVRGDNTLRSRLAKGGLLGNKHIPDDYLRASVEQRRELLAGLMDTDGTIGAKATTSALTFSNTNQRLAEQVLELVRSLGFKAAMTSKIPRIKGREYARHYSVRFTARVPVFRLARKLARQCLDGDRTRTQHRSIVAIEPVESVPVRCITVSSSDSTYLAGRDFTVTHNTQNLAIGYVIWKLGKDPTSRIALICDTATQACDRLALVKKHIEENPRVREVFPNLKPDFDAGWSSTAIHVQVPSNTMLGFAKDPSVVAVGSGGPINGKRLDLVVLDDVCDFENTRTIEGCQKLVEWFDSTVDTRVIDGGQIVAIGTPWSVNDLMAVLQKKAGWAARTYSIVTNPGEKPSEWVPLWPDVWPLRRVIEKFMSTPMLTFFRKYFCKITSDATSRFREEWFTNAKRLGRGRTFLPHAPILQPSSRRLPCFTGLDLGMSPRKKRQHGGTDHGSGLTVFFTIAIDERARRLVVNIESGRWTAPVIVDKLAQHWARYQSQFIVEDNGTQAFLIQFAEARGIPITPFTTTGSNKFHEQYGIESIAVELRSGLWVFPSGADGNTVDEELSATVAELHAFSPDSHTGDRAMALWFAREGARSLIASLVQSMPTISR